MKNFNINITFSALLLLLLTGTGQAQDKIGDASGECFNADSKIINAGIGIGASYYSYGGGGGYTYRRTPALSLSYEQAYPEKLGPGYLGLGAYLGYQGARWRYNDYYYGGNRYYYEHRWRYYVLAARAAYHLDFLNTEKGELYFGAMLGVRIQTYNYKTNSADPHSRDYEWTGRSVYPASSLFIGGRWYFAPKVAVYGELGYGISYLTLGLSFKL